MQYISFEIKALEPVKMGTHGSQTDTEYALGYIAGSTIRGAFIHSLLRKNGIRDLNENVDLKKNMLGGKYKFLNAYPEINGKRALPFPKCFYSNKEEAKKYEGNGKLSMINEFHHSIDENCVKVSLGEFCIFENEHIETKSARKIFNLHIAKGEKDNNIFRYEALKANQSFVGVITIKDATEADINETIELLEGRSLYLGGSKGSGYGKCQITNVTVLKDNPEKLSLNPKEKNEFYIYATSDIIARDEFGRFIGYIDEKHIQEKLNLEEVEFVQSSTLTQVATGYNNTWQCRVPQVLGLKAGSIFKYRYKGNLKDELVDTLMNDGVGDRREEGFGRILFIQQLDFQFAQPAKIVDKKVELPSQYSKKEEKLLSQILTRIYKNAIQKDMDRKIIELSKETKDRPLNNAQLGKLLELTVTAKGKSPEEGKKLFENYFTHLKGRTGQKAYNQIQDSRVNGEKLSDYILNFVNESDQVDAFLSKNLTNRDSFEIQNIFPDINASFVYESNMTFLESFFRYRIRVKKGEKSWV